MIKKMIFRFNPYSIGFYSLIIIRKSLIACCASFNPYSIGFYSLILRQETFLNMTKIRFQSLFYWILFFYKKGTRSKFWSRWKFQSLFYWILFFYPFYRADSLFSTLIEFFWESNSIKINRYMTRFLLFFHLFP